MSNKKYTKLAVLSLLGVMSLVGCNSSSDEIYAKPTNYEDSVVTIKNDAGEEQDVHNNILSIIYDSMHDGSVPSKVLEKVLYKYAESIVGVYNKYTAKGEDVITLEEAANDSSANHEKINQFIKVHKAYWLYNEDGEHIKEDGTVIGEKEDWTPCDTERNNVKSKLDAIELRIAEEMYSKATTGSYTEKHFFKELDLVKALYKDNKKVDYEGAKAAGLLPTLVDYQLEESEVFDTTKGLLHREFYQDKDATERKFTYIEDELIPTIYNDLLIEQYLLDEDLAAVRNSRARKINVIKIEKYSSFTNNADLLIKHLVNAIYENAVTAATTNDGIETKTSVIEQTYDKLFDTYAIVNKGLYTQISNNADATAVVNDLKQAASDIYELKSYTYGTAPDDVTLNYYNNTAYGDLVKDFEKFLSAENYEELDSSLYNKFTGSGKTTYEEGLDQATIEIDQTKSITKGWFIQSTQPSLDGNGTINDRLFKLSVANNKYEVGGEDDSAGTDDALIASNLETLTERDRIVKDGSTWKVRDAVSDKENKYICSINGAYFLKFEGQYSQDDWTNDIVYDDGDAYYIVNVLEAVKDNKLRAKGDYSYSKLRGTSFLNEVIDEISKKVAETGSYASLAKEHWLKQMDITYHDQKVYDYFKDNYPDLFD